MGKNLERTGQDRDSVQGSSTAEDETSVQQPSLEQLTEQVAKGGGIAFVGNIVGRFFTFLLQILLTRVLGAAGSGLYALGFSVLGIAQTVSLLGLQNGVVRFGGMHHGAGDRSRLKGTLLLALGISFASAVIVGTVLFFLASTIARGVFNEPALTAPIRVFAFALPFYSLVTITSFSARALRRVDCDVAISRLFRPILTLLAVGTSFLLGYRLLGAVSGFLISTVLSAGMGLHLLHRLFPDLTSKLRAKYDAKRLILYSGTVLLAGISSLLLTRTDRIMLGILDSAESVGIYNAAANLAVQATLFLTSFNAIFSPMIADLFHRGQMEQLERLFKTITKWIVALTLPVVLVLILFAEQSMRLFGAEFVVGAPVLIALSIAGLLNVSAGSVGFILIMTGHQKLALMNSLILGGLNVFLNLLLIPRFGILGAGVATGTSIALINLVKLIEVYLLYKIHPYEISYWKPAVSGMVAAATWLGVRCVWDPAGWLMLLGIGCFAMVYGISLAVLGLEEEDRLVLMVLRRKIVLRHRRGS